MGLGHGHLVRTLAVIHSLTSRGVQATVATRARGERVASLIAQAGARQVELPTAQVDGTADGPTWSPERQVADAEQMLEQAGGGWDAILVDHYQLDVVWEAAIRASTERLVVIDDLANRPHQADVLVDHNWYGRHTADRYRDLVDVSTCLLLGPRYALLHPNYADHRRHRTPVAHPPRRVLVSFGGTDPRGQTIQVIRALSVLPTAEVDVVMGTAAAVSDELLAAVSARPSTRLHVELPGLAPLLARADLVLGAAGTSTWERLCMRVPALVTTVSASQSGVTRALHEAGMTQWIGMADGVDVEAYQCALHRYVESRPMDLPAIVDGHGAARVSLAAVPMEWSEPTVREARADDDASFNTAGGAGIIDRDGPAAWRRRSRWFQEGANTQIVEVAGVPVGVLGGPEYAGTAMDPYIFETRKN